MNDSAPSTSSPRDALLGLAAASFGLVVLAHIAVVFASQAPSSPYRLPLFPGPLEELRGAAAAVSMGAALFSFSPELRYARFALAAAMVGLSLVAFVAGVCATTGMVGLQLADPRPFSSTLFFTRSFGEVLLFVAFALGLSSLRSKSPH